MIELAKTTPFENICTLIVKPPKQLIGMFEDINKLFDELPK